MSMIYYYYYHLCVCVGIKNVIVNALSKCSPEVLFLVFGKKRMLSSTMFWQHILSTSVYCWVSVRVQ